ncbi:uncharacterized protein LOC107270578 isoform X2 [Cephus cinctus]|uniref:Uncharacterized protein LOC107270578 isoform X2 n=1 Tax=Cephus cinctus TaxID=211228 RepID=A0AAJ7C4Y1_CEPCN|nr:uncharacterized protein LOC107270578 isoform X2 [Cephus cinctus]
MAGTANDYIGTLSVTRSGRTCAKWMSDYDLEKLKKANETTTQRNDKNPTERIVQPVTSNINKPVHAVNPVYFNDSLYPERNVINASNYCRDPSRNIAGTWCYTTDPLVPQDLCNVRDCEKPEECIFFVRGHGIGRHLYVLPEHRSEGIRFSLKEWEPDRPDSITFVFKADNGLKSRYILKVGAIKNERVLLYVESEDQGIKLVKTKTLPHLLYLGKWSSFVIRIPRGRVQVFYEGAAKPLFEWEHPEPSKAFLPIYYYYTSELGNTIGVSFDCHTRCHIETTETDRFTRILPLSMWRTEETPSPDKLILMIRGKGVILIPLLLLPATSGYYGLTIGEFGQWIFFLRNTYPLVHIFHKQKAPGPLFTTDSWTNITIRWHNNTIEVLRNETVVFHYEHTSPLLFYFFSLAVDTGGWATWAANCIPSDIDGDAEDGGWSEWGPWACSASCNGGMGTRKRLCNSPEPNVRGEPCLGPSIMTGRCNMNICGDITDDTLALITRKIQKSHTTLQVNEGHAITISVDPDIIDSIKTDSSDVELHWSRNGIFIQEEKDRLEIEDFDIRKYRNYSLKDAFGTNTLTCTVISKAILNDSGIYTITLHRVDGSHLIVKIISLAVYPLESIVSIRETLPFLLTCHCVTLGYVFSDLKIYWMIGKRVWKDYGTTLPIAVNVDYIDALNRSHQGTWRCVVEQNDLEFKWITNIVILKVLGAPNWRTHLMEDKLTRPIFGWMPNESFVAVSAIILFLALSMCIVGATVGFIKFQDSLKFKEATIGSNLESGKTSFMTRFKKGLKTSSLRTSGRVSESNENTETDDLLHGRNKRPKEKGRRNTEEYTEDTSPSDSEGVPKESLKTQNFLDRWKLKKREKKVPRTKEVTDESEREKLLNTNNTDEYQSDQPTTN